MATLSNSQKARASASKDSTILSVRFMSFHDDLFVGSKRHIDFTPTSRASFPKYTMGYTQSCE